MYKLNYAKVLFEISKLEKIYLSILSYNSVLTYIRSGYLKEKAWQRKL